MMCKLIPLYAGFGKTRRIIGETLVSPEDYDELSRYEWTVHRKSRTSYAKRQTVINGAKKMKYKTYEKWAGRSWVIYIPIGWFITQSLDLNSVEFSLWSVGFVVLVACLIIGVDILIRKLICKYFVESSFSKLDYSQPKPKGPPKKIEGLCVTCQNFNGGWSGNAEGEGFYYAKCGVGVELGHGRDGDTIEICEPIYFNQITYCDFYASTEVTISGF